MLGNFNGSSPVGRGLATAVCPVWKALGSSGGLPELLELDHEPFKGELGIGVHRKIMPELLEQAKKLNETFNRQGTGKGSKFCPQIMIVQRERRGNFQEH